MKAEQLRKSILQMAIQGKLVPQDPNDEPASVLLERIRAEKQRLIKEGKIKKYKSESVIFRGEDNRYYEKVGKETVDITDEIEIELPETWCVCRLSTIANIFTGNSINEQEKAKKYTGLPDGYNYIATKDVSFEHTINYLNGVKIPFDTQFRIAHSGTPLLCIEGGSAGRKIGILSEDVCFGNKLCAFESFGINTKYLYYYLQNPKFIEVFKSNTTGIIGGVSVNVLKTLFFFLPPLAEQARIVAEIEKYEPLLSAYDKLEQQATKLDNEIYDKLKKSILQYAIQGKLVPQDENDEPASVLLERIRAEKKAKLGKKYVESYIYKGDDNCYYEKIGTSIKNIDDEIPFEIPSNWAWCRLGDILEKLSDGTHSTPKYVADGVPFISVKDMSSGKLSFANAKKITIEEHEILYKRCDPRRGDIILSKVGTTGIPVLVETDIEFSLFVSVAQLRFSHKYINPQFLIYLLKSPLVQKQCEENTRGVGNKNWVMRDISNTLIVIPPLLKQMKIVEEIDGIFVKFEGKN